ncbi:MAG: hypothetical protein CMH54_01330 [Myxococcales bacterium]|nr:hypothetical protein [Myxococcales bacterium]|tara:strand:- start:190 stop:393 length:204 start_codon:yes stop_codon:yes gene_type:complete
MQRQQSKMHFLSGVFTLQARDLRPVSNSLFNNGMDSWLKGANTLSSLHMDVEQKPPIQTFLPVENNQ